MNWLCFILGHKWRELAWSSRHINLCHLSTLAGICATCTRCQAQWCDIPPDYKNYRNETHSHV